MTCDTPAYEVPSYDVIVVGAGAAGLLAASRSAERNRRTLLIEKNRKPGVKILISGGTRCNLTHDCDERGIIEAFGSAGPFLHSPLAALGPRELVDLFHASGLPTKVEANGKIFPQSDRAVDVVQALLGRLTTSGAELALGEPVVAMERRADSFLVSTSRRLLRASRLLVTTGGRSYPGCGTTGDGYKWLAEWGHTIRRPRPALVPLTSDESWVRELSGMTIPDVLLRVVDPRAASQSESQAESQTASQPRKRRRRGLAPGVLIERRGSLLFTHLGLSGPVALDVSRAVTGAPDPRQLVLLADYLPDMTPTDLSQELARRAAAEGKKLVVSLLPDPLPRRLVEAMFVRTGIDLARRAAELSIKEREAIVEGIKRCSIRVTGTRGFEKAEVTAGGVLLDEVDSRTMQSKLVPNLYLAGEILDLDGFIGGYNFQAAFSTGWLAGGHV